MKYILSLQLFADENMWMCNIVGTDLDKLSELFAYMPPYNNLHFFKFHIKCRN